MAQSPPDVTLLQSVLQACKQQPSALFHTVSTLTAKVNRLEVEIAELKGTASVSHSVDVLWVCLAYSGMLLVSQQVPKSVRRSRFVTATTASTVRE